MCHIKQMQENSKVEVSDERWSFHSHCCVEAAVVPPATLQPSTNPHRLFFFPLSATQCVPQEAKAGEQML